MRSVLANKKSNNGALSSFAYELDKTGNRTKRTTQYATLQYTYDNIYEITEVYRLSPNPSTLETFGYDGVGNRTTDADYSDYSYNTNNQLTSYDSMALEYDKNGNLTKKTQNGTDVTTATFDHENRLIRIDYPNGEHSEYRYDALGQRIEQRMRNGNIRRFYYDGLNLLAVYDASNALLVTVTSGLGIDEPMSLFIDGKLYYYHADALGSVYQMTDSNESVAKNYDYSAFGKIIAESGMVENTFTYTGREYDSDSGLYHYRARQYDANEGRFLSRDPIEKRGTRHLYLYAGNNPMSYRDPLGLFSMKNQNYPKGCCKKSDVSDAVKNANTAASNPRCRQIFIQHCTSQKAMNDALSAEIETEGSKNWVCYNYGDPIKGYHIFYDNDVHLCQETCKAGVRDMTITILHEAFHLCGVPDAGYPDLGDIYAEACMARAHL
jgi:RHS repeat-associated protein